MQTNQTGETNRARDRMAPEYELLDTGIFDAEELQEKVEEIVMEKIAEAVQKKAEEVQQDTSAGTDEKKEVL